MASRCRIQHHSTPGSSRVDDGDEPSVFHNPSTSTCSGSADMSEGHEVDVRSFVLVIPDEWYKMSQREESIKARSEMLFSVEHVKLIIEHPVYLQQLAHFLHEVKPDSNPLWIDRINAIKALRAIGSANGPAGELGAFTTLDRLLSSIIPVPQTTNTSLVSGGNEALEALAREELPAYVNHVWTGFVHMTIKHRITNTLPSLLQDLSDGPPVFCLTDPSRYDNPIVFASEGFHRVTQYGRGFALGRNCRFLQGANTDRRSVQRLKDMLDQGKEHSETLLNYRRDGSVFMNLVTVVPLFDSNGSLCYFLGIQVDVSKLLLTSAGLGSLRDLVAAHQVRLSRGSDITNEEPHTSEKALGSLAGNFTVDLNKSTKQHASVKGKGKPQPKDMDSTNLIPAPAPATPTVTVTVPVPVLPEAPTPTPTAGLRRMELPCGVLEHYLLVEPSPSLRIVFTSPSLNVPGMVQVPFLSRICGPSDRGLLEAKFRQGQGAKVKVRWLTSERAPQGCIPGSAVSGTVRPAGPIHRTWVHTTPLLGIKGEVGAWMIILVDDDDDDKNEHLTTVSAPPIAPFDPNKTRCRKEWWAG